jgi:hypothetical protein
VRRLRRAAVALAVAGTAACSVRIASLTAAATAPVAETPRESCGRRVGRSCRWQIVGAPLGLPRIDEAMAAAMAPVGGRLLREVVVTSDHTFWVFFGQNCYTVEGEVFR